MNVQIVQHSIKMPHISTKTAMGITSKLRTRPQLARILNHDTAMVIQINKMTVLEYLNVWIQI